LGGADAALPYPIARERKKRSRIREKRKLDLRVYGFLARVK
jgi:hypothetical protein